MVVSLATMHSSTGKGVRGNGSLLNMTLENSSSIEPFIVHASCNNMDPDDKVRLATNLQFVDPVKPYYKVFGSF